MSRGNLLLALSPVRRDKFLIMQPCEVNFLEVPWNQSVTEIDRCRCQSRRLASDYRKTNELLNRLQTAMIARRTLLEFVVHDGHAMWQFLPSWLWPSFFRAVELIDSVLPIIEEVEPREVQLLPVDDHTNPIWEGIVKAICASRGIPINVMAHESINCPSPRNGFRVRVRSYLSREAFGRFLIGVYRLARNPETVRKTISSALRDIRSLDDLARCPRRMIQTLHEPEAMHRSRKTGPRLGDHPTETKRLLCATLGKRHWVNDPTAQNKQYDEQFYPLLPAFQAAGWKSFVLIDCEDSPIEGLELRQRRADPEILWGSFDSYPGEGARDHKRSRDSYQRMFEILRKDEGFSRDFSYREVPLMPALEKELQWAFDSLLPLCSDYLSKAKQVLLEAQPDAVVATYETGPRQRSLILVAALLGIPTMGLQHGMMFSNNYDYMHERIAADPVKTPVGFHVPQITCVWGPMWKDTLCKGGHYPSESVVVTGNWRQDYVQEIAKTDDVATLRKRLGILPDVRTVLILTAADDIAHYISLCILSLKGIPGTAGLIKLHPSDDAALARETLRRHDYPEHWLIEEPLASILTCADLVVSQVSTAVAEAALCGKPIVLATLNECSGWEHYVEEGICLHATNSAELSRYIAMGLNDSFSRDRMARARAKFIPRYFFRNDGLAAERMVEALETKLIPHSHELRSVQRG